MKYLLFAVIYGVVLYATSSAAFETPHGRQFSSNLSLQSFSGILNTPNAFVVPEGTFQGVYTNQKESVWRDHTVRQENYLFMVGMFNFLEIGGQLFDAPRVGRDLSGSLKVTSAPWTSKYSYLPTVGVGIQDVSGGATLLKTRYLVLSEDLWRLRLSVGYGAGPDRMEGVFGGGEFKAHDWVYLLGEYDTKEWNAGIRFVAPRFLNFPIGLTATVKSSLGHRPGALDMAIGFSLPLDFKVRDDDQGHNPDIAPDIAAPLVTSSNDRKPKSDSAMETSRMIALRNRLIEAGFFNVKVGELENHILVVEYENSLFNHNELDALGVVAGMTAATMPEHYKEVFFVLKKKNIRMASVALRLAELAAYLDHGQAHPDLLERLKDTVSVSTDTDAMGRVAYVDGDGNSAMFATSLVLFPGLTTIVGNEYGVFDYVLSLKVNPQMTLWKGAMLNAQWDIPLLWSDNMNKGHVFQDKKSPARLDRLMLAQGIKPLPDLLLNLGGGVIFPNVYGMLNELVWQPGDGRHRMQLIQSWGKNTENNRTNGDDTSYLASYRYYFSQLDLSLEGMLGRFRFQDEGCLVDVKKYFGDTAVSLYYKNSTTTLDKKHWQSVGIRFSFPLSPAKDMKHVYKMQARGLEQWSYAQETTLKNSNSNDPRGALNYISDVSLGVVPDSTGSLNIQYLNRDRLNRSYILSNLSRLRASWRDYLAREAPRTVAAEKK